MLDKNIIKEQKRRKTRRCSVMNLKMKVSLKVRMKVSLKVRMRVRMKIRRVMTIRGR